MPYKPGYRTTEFWVAVLTAVGSLVAALAGDLTPRWAALAAAISSAAYSIARGLSKQPVVPVVPSQVPPPQP